MSWLEGIEKRQRWLSITKMSIAWMPVGMVKRTWGTGKSMKLGWFSHWKTCCLGNFALKPPCPDDFPITTVMGSSTCFLSISMVGWTNVTHGSLQNRDFSQARPANAADAWNVAVAKLMICGGGWKYAPRWVCYSSCPLPGPMDSARKCRKGATRREFCFEFGFYRIVLGGQPWSTTLRISANFRS